MTEACAPTLSFRMSSGDISKSMTTGNRCASLSHCRLLLIVGKLPSGALSTATPNPVARTLPLKTRPGKMSNAIPAESPRSTLPRLFSVKSAWTQMSSVATKVICGTPAAAKLPRSRRTSVTTPVAGATMAVRSRSSCACSSADSACIIRELSSPTLPRFWRACSRFALAAASCCSATIREASAVSTRRSDMAPGS